MAIWAPGSWDSGWALPVSQGCHPPVIRSLPSTARKSAGLVVHQAAVRHGASLIPTPGHLQNEAIRLSGNLLTSPKKDPLSLEQSWGLLVWSCEGPHVLQSCLPCGLRGTHSRRLNRDQGPASPARASGPSPAAGAARRPWYPARPCALWKGLSTFVRQGIPFTPS